jgi:hypothetical protein
MNAQWSLNLRPLQIFHEAPENKTANKYQYLHTPKNI